jgi:uncharacterized delta-60 repeat protein
MRARPLTALAGGAVTAFALVSCTSILGDFSLEGDDTTTPGVDASCTGAGCIGKEGGIGDATTHGGDADADMGLGSITLSPTSVSLARGDMVDIAVQLGNAPLVPVDVYLVSPPDGVTTDALRIPAGMQSGTLTLHVGLAAFATLDTLTVAATEAGRTVIGGDSGSGPDSGAPADAGGTKDAGDAGDAATAKDAGGGPTADAGPVALPAGTVTAPFALTVEGTNGGIDTAFGAMGTLVVHPSTGSDIPFGIAFDSMGRAIIVGNQGTPAQAVLVRITEAGALDTSFGTAGFAHITGLATSTGTALAVSTGDEVYVGGTTTAPGTPSALVAAFTSAGALDTAFAAGRGYVYIDTGGDADAIRGIANLGGTLVLGGTRTLGATSVGLLAGFTTAGVYANESTASLTSSLVIGGFTPDGTTALWLPAFSSSAGGTLDTLSLGRSGSGSAHFDTTYAAATGGFASSTFAATAFTGDARAAAQSTGRVVVAGTPVAGSSALVGFSAAGAVDPTFGTAGIATTDTGSAADVAVDSADGILVAGSAGTAMNLLRFDSTGTLDTTFADGFPAGQTFDPSALTRVAVDPKGRVWVVGHGQKTAGDDDWIVARFLP